MNQMHCLLPLSSKVDRSDSRISGPLWVSATGDSSAMRSMTEEAAMDYCGPEDISDALDWKPRELELERRRVARSVRNLAEEGSVIGTYHHNVVDDLASWL